MAVRPTSVDRGQILRPLIAALVGMFIGTLLIGPLPAVLSRMTNDPTVGGNTMATAASFDVVAPSIAGSVLSKTTPYLAGSIKPSGSFYVYADVTDTGANASGVASVTADVSSIRAGATALALVAGSYTAQGVSFNYRSASRVADAKPAGTYSYSIRAVDNAGNVATGSFTVIVDATAPSAADVQSANGGATVGRPELGDSITFTYSEQIDPQTILSGWTGAATNVVVRFTNNGSTDGLAIWNAANTAQLRLGSVNTNGDYVSANLNFGATGTPSTMIQSGSTITITLGTASSTSVRTNSTARAMVWTPSAIATDAAGNACSTAATTETGANDVDL